MVRNILSFMLFESRAKYIAIAIFALVFVFIVIKHDRNPLEEFGYSYDLDIGPTGTYYSYEFFRKYKGREIRGPLVAGSMLKLSYDDIDSDGMSEIIIKSSVDKSYRTIIKAHPEILVNGKHFSIVNSKGLKVNWPIDGYTYH
ncbi:hypothetical protein [Candidatus Electrothrix sp.]|uniref:hypothetical protein n=2 Tax=Candidatus Electrothrix sp. TaxID=2170559 RepID=UPI0040566E5E